MNDFNHRRRLKYKEEKKRQAQEDEQDTGADV